MNHISLDIETYSSVDLSKSSVYRYSEAPDFEILLLGYSVDDGPVQVVDLASGERIPAEILAALTDERVTKWAFNANFERVCLSRYLGMPNDEFLDPAQWHCTMIWSAYLGLPLSLMGVGAAHAVQLPPVGLHHHDARRPGLGGDVAQGLVHLTLLDENFVDAGLRPQGFDHRVAAFNEAVGIGGQLVFSFVCHIEILS